MWANGSACLGSRAVVGLEMWDELDKLSHVFLYIYQPHRDSGHNSTNMNNTIHVGHLVERYVNSVSGLTISELARQLNCSRRNVYRIFDRHSMDTSLLIRLCSVLKHDFFHDISASITLHHDET